MTNVIIINYEKTRLKKYVKLCGVILVLPLLESPHATLRHLLDCFTEFAMT